MRKFYTGLALVLSISWTALATATTATPDPLIVPTEAVSSVVQVWVKAGFNPMQLCNPGKRPDGGNTQCHRQDTSTAGDFAKADAVAQTIPSPIITTATATVTKVTTTTSTGAAAFAAAGGTWRATGVIKGPRTSLKYGNILLSGTTDPVHAATIVVFSDLPENIVYGDLLKQCFKELPGNISDSDFVFPESVVSGTPKNVFATLTAVLHANGELKAEATSPALCDSGSNQSKCSPKTFITKQDFEDGCAKDCAKDMKKKRMKNEKANQTFYVLLPDLEKDEKINLHLDEVHCTVSESRDKQLEGK